MPARTDLWEPRDGNAPRPPGPERAAVFCLSGVRRDATDVFCVKTAKAVHTKADSLVFLGVPQIDRPTDAGQAWVKGCIDKNQDREFSS